VTSPLRPLFCCGPTAPIDIPRPLDMTQDAHQIRLPGEAASSLDALWNRVASPFGIDISREELRSVAAAVSSAARSVDMLPE